MTPHSAALPRTARPLWLLLLLSLLTWLAACNDSTPSPPVISVQPSDASTVAGTAATLSVTASGTDIAYQWQLSSDGGTTWANVAGATQASHTTAATTPADTGRRYRVIVSAAGISVTSSSVQLTVTVAVVAPALAVQPAAQSATAPAAAAFNVTASGTALGYQWQRSADNGANWVNIAGATAASYSTGSTDVSMNASQYRVVVSNSAGSATSTAAVLSVAAAPLAAAFTTQPADQSVSAGNAAAFTVAATGNPTPTLQWQRSSDNGSNWSDIAGATGATHNTGPTTSVQNGERYRARADNSAGSATSNVATLSVAVGAAPSFTAQPTSSTIQAGQAASFIVGVSGTPTPTLQWQLSTDGGASWSNINGATSDVLSLPAGVPLADNGRQFRAVASNTAGSATSNAAVLTVTPALSGSFQFNLFGFNAGPSVFQLYGGSVKDNGSSIDCSGYAALADPCPKWRGNYANGTVLTLTATPWPGFRVSRWVGGDCGSPGTATTVALTIDHNSNCFPQFEVIPGSTFSISAVAAGAWVGLVGEVVADRFGNLVVPDTPRISCGPLASAQICETIVDVPGSVFIQIRLRAYPLNSAPVGQLRWTCTSTSPVSGSPVVRTVSGADIALGPIYGNTACSAEFIPTI